jgi:hypothetical protein
MQKRRMTTRERIFPSFKSPASSSEACQLTMSMGHGEPYANLDSGYVMNLKDLRYTFWVSLVCLTVEDRNESLSTQADNRDRNDRIGQGFISRDSHEFEERDYLHKMMQWPLIW